MARRAGLRWVITNNVHYARREEYRLRDVMACIQTNTTLDDWTDIRHRNAEYYLKTEDPTPAGISPRCPETSVETGLAAGRRDRRSMQPHRVTARCWPLLPALPTYRRSQG